MPASWLTFEARVTTCRRARPTERRSSQNRRGRLTNLSTRRCVRFSFLRLLTDSAAVSILRVLHDTPDTARLQGCSVRVALLSTREVVSRRETPFSARSGHEWPAYNAADSLPSASSTLASGASRLAGPRRAFHLYEGYFLACWIRVVRISAYAASASSKFFLYSASDAIFCCRH